MIRKAAPWQEQQGLDHQPGFPSTTSPQNLVHSPPLPTRRHTDPACTLSWPVSHFPLRGLIPLLSGTQFPRSAAQAEDPLCA